MCERDGAVEGYAYASLHRERPAYRWSVEVSAYIHEQHRGRGIGRALYTALFQLLRQQGFYRAYAGITLPNEASVGLHEAMGFEPVGIYRGVGYKAGAWRDVGRWGFALQTGDGAPAEPLPISEIGSQEWHRAISAGEALFVGNANQASGTGPSAA